MGVADRTPGPHGPRTRAEPTRKATLMSPGYYPSPPKPISTRVRCPVCHEDVYSRAGIHPQCAVRQAESPMPKGIPGEPEQGLKAVEPVRVEADVDPPTANRSSACDRIPV